MADEILVKYQADITQITKQLDIVQKELIETENVGEEAFNGITAAAKNAGKGLEDVSQKAAKTKTQFNGLQNSINQISREMPAFAVNMNTGFLAISNNLPILFDEINKINAANKELAAQGKQTTSVMKQLSASIFSMGTALSVGVTLLTLYGGKLVEMIGSLINGKAALDGFRISLGAVVEAMRDKSITNKVVEFEKLRHEIDLAQKGFVNKEKTLKMYNNRLGATIGYAKSLNEAEALMIKNKDAYIRAIVDKMAAEQLMTKAAEKRNEAIALRKEEVSVMEKAAVVAKDFYGSWFGMSNDAGSMEEAIFNARKERADRLNKEAQVAEEEAKKLIGNQSFVDQNLGSTKQEDELLHSLQRQRMILEANGESTFEIDKKIFARRIELAKEDAIQRKDLESELQAYIIKSRRESNEAYAKIAEDRIKQEEKEMQELLKIRQAGEQASVKHEREQWSREAELAIERTKREREIEGRNYKARLQNEQTSFAERRQIIDDMEKYNYITVEEATNERIKLYHTEAEAKIATMQAVGNTISNLASLIGEESEDAKALAIAGTLIETYAAAQSAYAGYQKLPQPYGTIAGAAAAAAAVTAGLVRVQKITSVNVKKSSKRRLKDEKVEQSFKDGVVDLQGPGTSTSDSIPAWLSKGESVIKASSTVGYKDELKALNSNPLDYERLISIKYVKPALDAQQKETALFAEKIAASFAMQKAFTGENIVKELKKSRKEGKRDMNELILQMEKRDRQTRFENRLSKDIGNVRKV